jgi:hypothetical protein
MGLKVARYQKPKQHQTKHESKQPIILKLKQGYPFIAIHMLKQHTISKQFNLVSQALQYNLKRSRNHVALLPGSDTED